MTDDGANAHGENLPIPREQDNDLTLAYGSLSEHKLVCWV
jgi:hypothetical protein